MSEPRVQNILSLPRRRATRGADSTVPLAEPVRGGNETIMVVEDEPVLREMVCEILKQYDYQVIEAGSGVEALRVWDEFDGRVDLLLTDMVMPEGMTGRELAVQLKKRKPELKVIYSSGYSPVSNGRDIGQNVVTVFSGFARLIYHPSSPALSANLSIPFPCSTSEPVPAWRFSPAASFLEFHRRCTPARCLFRSYFFSAGCVSAFSAAS